MMVWQNGVAVETADIPILNDLSKAQKYSKLPDNALYVPVVVPAADGTTPIMGLVDPDALRKKVEVIKFADVVITKAGLTIGSGVSVHTAAVAGVIAGDFLVGSVKSATAGWNAFNPTATADGQITVYMYGPALVAGGFTCTIRLIALR